MQPNIYLGDGEPEATSTAWHVSAMYGGHAHIRSHTRVSEAPVGSQKETQYQTGIYVYLVQSDVARMASWCDGFAYVSARYRHEEVPVAICGI